jgi:hypothetical protein
MERLARHNPGGHAMLDDEVRRINDEIRFAQAKQVNGNSRLGIDDSMEAIAKAYMKLLTAYRNRCGRAEIKALAVMLNSHLGCLIKSMDMERFGEHENTDYGVAKTSR